MTGRLWVVGLGPGDASLQTPQATVALADVSDIVGYAPYLERIPPRPGQSRHGSDNRVEPERARHALGLAAAGRRVAVVSGGDPGVFAMASVVFEAVESGPPSWRELDIEVVPGISAMFAAAARIGAPLGHDFCAISLSDLLTPWPTIRTRLEAAALGDFVVALYNPRSARRATRLAEAAAILLAQRDPATPALIARNLGRDGETWRVATLAALADAEIDMLTIVIVGSRKTRLTRTGPPRLYTPRGYRRK